MKRLALKKTLKVMILILNKTFNQAKETQVIFKIWIKKYFYKIIENKQSSGKVNDQFIFNQKINFIIIEKTHFFFNM